MEYLEQMKTKIFRNYSIQIAFFKFQTTIEWKIDKNERIFPIQHGRLDHYSVVNFFFATFHIKGVVDFTFRNKKKNHIVMSKQQSGFLVSTSKLFPHLPATRGIL